MRSGHIVVTVLVLISVHSVVGQAWSVQLDKPKSFASQNSLKADDFDLEESNLDDSTDYESSDQDEAIPSDVSAFPKLSDLKGSEFLLSDRSDIEANSNSDWNRPDVEDETVF
jgi:hypothetical protein